MGGYNELLIKLIQQRGQTQTTEKELLLIAVNLSKETRRQEIRIPEEAFAFHNMEPQDKQVKATELFTGKTVKCKLTPNSPVQVNIPALSGTILKFKLA